MSNEDLNNLYKEKSELEVQLLSLCTSGKDDVEISNIINKIINIETQINTIHKETYGIKKRTS